MEPVLVSQPDGRVEARLADHSSPLLTARQASDGCWDIDDGTPRIGVEDLTVLLEHLRDTCARSGTGGIRWWARPAGPETDQAAEAVGMHCDREIRQLRRELPVPDPVELRTRSFQPGVDDDAWLGVNNAAFPWHEEQGGWTLEDLRRRVAEPWFDPEGFRILERDGGMAGFCWTKVHLEENPPLGEIYVIGVDPRLQGQGLGRALTIAGLDHLARRGMSVGMLFVEADNEPALNLYRSLGFEPHHVERRYVTWTQPAVSTPSNDPTA